MMGKPAFRDPMLTVLPDFWRLLYFLFRIGGTARCFLDAPTLATCVRVRERER